MKPSNVIVELHHVTPVAKVIDFRIAKAVSGRLTEHSVRTNFAQLVGSPLYMSPEQAQQSAIDVDARSDIYSLGVLLYELLTGSAPFDRESLETSGIEEIWRIICDVDPPKPSARLSTTQAKQLSTISGCRKVDAKKLGQSLHGESDWIVMKTIDKDRNRRYESASALAADIQRSLNEEPVTACPPSTVYRLQKIAWRNRGLVTSGCLLAVAILVASGQLWSERSRMFAALTGERNQRQMAEGKTEIALRNESEARDQRNRALQSQYRAEIVSGRADWEGVYLLRLNQKLMGHLPLDGQPDRRGWEWPYRWSLCHPEIRTLRSAMNDSYVAWSPDGEYVAASGDIWRADRLAVRPGTQH